MIELVAKYIGVENLWISTPKYSLGAKFIVQKYDIICFRGKVYRAQSQNATVNFNFSRHVQFLHALFTK